MSQYLPSKPRRTYVACLACRKRKIKCFTDGSEKKACRRCSHKGIQCEYLPVPSAQKHAPSHSPFPPLRSTAVPSSNPYSATNNYRLSDSEYPQPSFAPRSSESQIPNHRLGLPQNRIDCGSYPAMEASSIYTLPVSAGAPVSQQTTFSRSPPNYAWC
ncbi:hypothetical protein C8R45DRAFT_1097181 [Mycena sanguinolenta]|nr:hypothetical protein C8R45DRAFT_1097181 [Mycena sanguinolenta]